MQILIHPSSVSSTPAITEHAVRCITHALRHVAQRVTRVDVHLHDDNGPKHGVAQRCVVEVHVARQHPLAVHHTSSDLYASIHTVATKLRRLVEKRVARAERR
jgi:ribosomal subunit interface protein